MKKVEDLMKEKGIVLKPEQIPSPSWSRYQFLKIPYFHNVDFVFLRKISFVCLQFKLGCKKYIESFPPHIGRRDYKKDQVPDPMNLD